MMQSTLAREAGAFVPAGQAHDEALAGGPPARQVPPTPAAAPAPPATGLPPEAREAIAQAIRDAQQAVEMARQDARTAQQEARAAQTRIQVEGDRVIVGGGAGAGAGSGAGGGPFIERIDVPPPHDPNPFEHIPPQAYDILLAFFLMLAFIAVGTPLARGFAKRMDRRPVLVAPSPELNAQLQRIEHGMEAMAIEVERISEAQRYTARLESERAADPARLARPGRRE